MPKRFLRHKWKKLGVTKNARDQKQIAKIAFRAFKYTLTNFITFCRKSKSIEKDSEKQGREVNTTTLLERHL
jgi:hypothetical protein